MFMQTSENAEQRRQSGPTISLADRFRAIRQFTQKLCEPLEIEDYIIQSMADASPTRWHIAHTTWFFETFVLARAVKSYQPFHPKFAYLFNSYYNSVGEQYPRPQRGVLSRPTVEKIFEYRAYVDRQMEMLLSEMGHSLGPELVEAIEIGLQHEQQHQELMLTDLKHAFSCNPIYPVYRSAEPSPMTCVTSLDWVYFPEGVRWLGHDDEGFCYDNELPQHREYVNAFELGTRLITNEEFMDFMEDGGYRRAELWLSEGWNAVHEHQWRHPLYWTQKNDVWWQYTLAGLRPVHPAEPVCHVSFFEADAYARWSGARLPTEAEWEVASSDVEIVGNFSDSEQFQPRAAGRWEYPCNSPHVIHQLFGDVWEWTSSQYLPYPGYRVPAGSLGEYNGKFMCNQFVLRGGSCATPRSHIRGTYRNFFPPAARWQFSGIRLAR